MNPYPQTRDRFAATERTACRQPRPMSVLAIATVSVLCPLLLHAQNKVTPEDVISALEANNGVHPGERRGFTKGTCAAGEFVGGPTAARYTRSALFSGQPVPVVARFSVAGGNPKVPDTSKNPRGMALEFRLPDAHLQHMTMSSAPVFGAASPQAFLDLTLAMRPDPATGRPDPQRIKAFRATHPDSAAQAQFLERNNPPVSYANSAYYSVHAFRFLDRDDGTTLVRWRFVPQDGEKRLTEEELKTAGANFLEPALIARVKQGPVRWDMMLTIGQPGDPENDPTLAWPDSRLTLKVGTLSLTSASPQKGAECERINFDPMVMADGISATEDPILRLRAAAYAISFAKRLPGE